jgi:chromosome segregation ATPase
MSQLQKELNPELFGDLQSLKTRMYEPTAANPMKVMEDKIFEMKKQILDLTESLGHFGNQVNEVLKSQQQKIDKIMPMIQKLENNDQILNQEAAQRIGQLHARMSERKTVDLKIQEMVDRHNSLVKSFEVRLSQMQKMLMDREAQALSAQAALNETKMELARLKRM